MTGNRMKARVRFTRPSDIEISAEITMPLCDWESLQKQLEGMEFPGYRLRQLVDEIVVAARDQTDVVAADD